MYYFHKNHLGSVIGITDKSGNTISEYDYDVFGKATLISGDDTGNTRLYTGREYDKEIGLYFLRARYYDPQTGRFISKDPIGQIDDVNLYAYVGNNSVMYVDLMGTEGKKVLVVGFYGWNGAELDSFPETHSQNGVGLMLDKVEKLNKGSNNTIDTLHYTSGQFSRGQTHAKNHILEKGDDYYDEIYLVGHSMGGDSAVEFSNTLAGMNIDVTGLITLDLEGVSDDTNIMSNVKKADNYYQTHTVKWYEVNHNGALLSGNKKNVKNHKVNYSCDLIECKKGTGNGQRILHTDMDDKFVDHFANKIYESIK